MMTLWACAPAFAQAEATVPAPAAPAPVLDLDLNALQPSQGGCRLTFVVRNALGGTVERAAFEMALFNKAGVVDRLTVLDFKGLQDGKTKVSRFDLNGVSCDDVSRILVNDVTECAGTGIASESCMAGLVTLSTSGVTFGR